MTAAKNIMHSRTAHADEGLQLPPPAGDPDDPIAAAFKQRKTTKDTSATPLSMQELSDAESVVPLAGCLDEKVAFLAAPLPALFFAVTATRPRAAVTLRSRLR